jgi:transposase
MIPRGVQVFVALDPIDLRWSFDRLAGAALERIGYDARCGALFIYFGKRRDAVKALFFDGSGMCQFYKRLDHGVFRLPEALEPGARHVELDEALLDALLDGVDLAQTPKRARAPRSRVRLH